MLKPGFLLQALPVIVIVLAAVLFIVMKMLSRLKPRDDMASSSTALSAAMPKHRAAAELKPLSGTYPVVVRTAQKRFRTKAKEISLAGAFIVCDPPVAVGEHLELSLELAQTVPLQATVTWNNSNVPKADIVASGMRVRFLDLSAEARSALLAPPPDPALGATDEAD